MWDCGCTHVVGCTSCSPTGSEHNHGNCEQEAELTDIGSTTRRLLDIRPVDQWRVTHGVRPDSCFTAVQSKKVKSLAVMVTLPKRRDRLTVTESEEDEMEMQ